MRSKKFFTVYNILMLFMLFALVVFIVSILFTYGKLDIYHMLVRLHFDADSPLINKIFGIITIKYSLFYLWIVNVCLFFAFTYIFFKRRNTKKLLLNMLTIINSENASTMTGYMFSDSWGHIYKCGDIFARIFNIKNEDIKSRKNFIKKLGYYKNSRVRVTKIQIDKLFNALKIQKVEIIDMPVNFGSDDSYYKLYVSPFCKGYCLWSISLVKGRMARKDNEFFEDMLNNMPVGIFAVNKDGAILYNNDKLLKMLGISKLDNNFNLKNFVIESEAIDISSSMPISILGQEKGMNGRLLIKPQDARQPFWVNLFQNIKYNSKGEVQYSRSILVPEHDKTNNTQLALRRKDAFSLLKHLPFITFVVNDFGDISFTNELAMKILDKQRFKDNILKFSNLNLLKIIPLFEDDSYTHVSEIKIDNIEDLYKVYVLKIKHGLYIVMFEDIQEIKNIKKIMQENQGLQVIGQIASSVAHDFNNLLTAIMGFADLLQERHSIDDPSFMEIEQIKQNSSRAMILIRKLLTFSRNRELVPMELDVNSSIADFMSTIGRIVGDNIQQSFKRGVNIGKIFIDETQFQQILTNLVNNAKYAMEKGGRIEITTSVKQFKSVYHGSVQTINPGIYVEVVVKDSGVGIEQENIKKIFKANFSTKGEHGNGLGLSTIMSIMKDNSGFINVESTKGEGSTFILYFPRVEDKDVNQDEIKQVESTSFNRDLTGSENILFIEDEIPVKMVCVNALKSKGYKVYDFDDAGVALSFLAKGDVKMDLIISDLVMPGMDGLEFIKKAREMQKNVPALLISGYEEDVIDKGVDLEKVDFLSKPFGTDVLAIKVKEVIKNGS